jgi:hypothetical protein
MDLAVRANFGYLVGICHLSAISVISAGNRKIRNIERLLTFRPVHVAHDVVHDF